MKLRPSKKATIASGIAAAALIAAAAFAQESLLPPGFGSAPPPASRPQPAPAPAAGQPAADLGAGVLGDPPVTADSHRIGEQALQGQGASSWARSMVLRWVGRSVAAPWMDCLSQPPRAGIRAAPRSQSQNR